MTNAVILLAAVLYAEAAGEPWAGKHAVASVMWHEAQMGRRDVLAVALNPRRYHGARRRNIIISGHADRQAWLECRDLAQQMLDNTFAPSGSWTHYYRPTGHDPAWTAQLRHPVRIGRHVFGRL